MTSLLQLKKCDGKQTIALVTELTIALGRELTIALVGEEMNSAGELQMKRKRGAKERKRCGGGRRERITNALWLN